MTRNIFIVAIISFLLIAFVLMYEKAKNVNAPIATPVSVGEKSESADSYSVCMNIASTRPTELGVKTAVDECKRVHVEEPKRKEAAAVMDYFNKLPDTGSVGK